MEIHIRYFAAIRERLQLEEERVTLDAPLTLAGLWSHLAELHPELAGLRRHIRLAINLDFAEDDTLLSDGDEVALIPPVAGGAGMLTQHPIDEAAVAARVDRPEAGALVTFRGVVRNHSKGKDVAWLEYEVYPDMAETKLAQVIDEVTAAWPDCQVAIEHRFGRLNVGDTAVVIAVSSPHRAEAFAACARAIDRIKEIVPIWKKEVGPDGSHWVGMGS